MTHLIDVLIVEDEQKIAEIHRRFTEKVDGFKVIGTATTGEEAKDWIEIAKPQLILLDVYLPDLLGIELVHYVRSLQLDVDIIMITAASEVNVVRGALQGGAFDYIVKPLMFERFRKSLLNYKQYREQLKEASSLTRGQIESLWSNTEKEKQKETMEIIPKGIDQLTLDKVLGFLSTVVGSGITAEILSREIGVSRSTARRYLEFLVAQKEVYAELVYGSIGRPERRYFRKQR